MHPPRNRFVSDYYVPLKLTKRPDDIVTLFIFQGLMAIINEGINARKIFVYFTLPNAITALFLPQTPLPSTPTLKRKSKQRSKRKKKSATVEDPEGEKPLSLILTTSSESPQPRATPTPSLIVFDTVLGIFFSFS